MRRSLTEKLGAEDNRCTRSAPLMETVRSSCREATRPTKPRAKFQSVTPAAMMSSSNSTITTPPSHRSGCGIRCHQLPLIRAT